MRDTGLLSRMHRRALLALGLSMLVGAVAAQGPAAQSGVLDHSFRQLAVRETVDLRRAYGGDVVLIVNTASKCGFTPQYEALEALHARLRPRGFAVLGFPSGDFRDQEFESDEKIAEFCKLNFGVTFPMFTRSSVKGDQANPLFKKLIAKTGEEPGWNFNKYLVGRDGKVIAHFDSKVEPDSPELKQAIAKALRAE